MEEAVDPTFLDTSPILGNDLGVFIGLTVVLFGRRRLPQRPGLAQTWRPEWQTVPIRTAGGRQPVPELRAVRRRAAVDFSGYVIDWIGACSCWLCGLPDHPGSAHVSQYPWLYERAGVFRLEGQGIPDGTTRLAATALSLPVVVDVPGRTGDFSVHAASAALGKNLA